MSQAFYRAGFEKQLTGSYLGGDNCAAASGAMMADQASLRLKNPTPDAFRKATGDFKGGLRLAQVGSTLENKFGIGVTVYDGSDGYTFDKLVADLRKGKFACVGGDYDQVPYALRGDKDFRGLHTEFWHRVTSAGISVADPLNDGRRAGIPKGYITYPLSVARAYVEKLDWQTAGKSLHACVMDLKRLRARPVSPATNVRREATRASSIIGKFGGTTTVVWGGTVKGESIGGNTTWYRIWWPATSSFGYCHSSVVAKV